MHGTKEIIEEAAALPVEDRVVVVDSLLRTLNAPDPDIDKTWAAVAERRLADLRSRRVKAVPGDEVFARTAERGEEIG
jgi:putative addiction module component (TIGR02574 family)